MSVVFKALSDQTRRRVLVLLRDGPKTAGQLAEGFPVSKPTMSAHFAVLREAGLVLGEKHGKAVTYRLRKSALEATLREFSELLGLDLRDRPAADFANVAVAVEKEGRLPVVVSRLLAPEGEK